MGWRYRKSINLGGGFRINLSKSGIGYSWGFPGYRHTYNANGSQRKTYSIPGTGISYIEESGKRNKNSGNNSNNNLNYNQNTKLITGDTEYYQNINISNMGKDDEILKQINKLRTIDIIANIFLISIYLIPIGIILKLLITYKWKIDLSYEMDDINKKKFDCLNSFLQEISKNNKVWQVGSSTRVYNTKYNAGAGNNITRHKVNILKKMPWYISHNIDVYCLNLTSEKIYFTPDRMFIFKKFGGVGSRKYNDMVANFSLTNFVETEFVPSDAEIIHYTWKYVNKSGGPDRRFNDNRQIPVCKYGEIGLESSDGINILLECSNHRLMQGIQDKFEEFMICHNKIINMSKMTTKEVEEQKGEQEQNINEDDKWNNYNNEFENDLNEMSNEMDKTLSEKKESQIIIEPNIENPPEDNKDRNTKQSNIIKNIKSIICNILCYTCIFFSSVIVLACIADKMFFATILWLANVIIFIPKVKNNFIKEYPKYSKYIIPFRAILMFVAFVVLGITIPRVFIGHWVSENNIELIIEKNTFKLIENGNSYVGTYQYNSIDKNNSDIIYYEIMVDYEENNESSKKVFHYYDDGVKKYICLYDNKCTEYFKLINN